MKKFITLLMGLVLLEISGLSFLSAQVNKNAISAVISIEKVLHADVHFDFGKYELKKDAIDVLDHLKSGIPPGKQTEVYVYGHTDWVGGLDYNQWLGTKRAEAVKTYLESQGIKATVVTESFGKTKPVADNETNTGRQRNRRVEVEFCILENNPQSTANLEAGGSEPVKKPVTPDSNYVYTQGSMIHLTSDVVYPYDLKDVKLEVKEIYTPEDMIENKATTQDKEGNTLISGGMVLIKATVNGEEIEANGEYTVNLPVEEYAIDKEMQVYTAVKKGGHLVWKLTTIPINIVTIKGKYYYQFTVRSFGGFNCDKYRLANKALKIRAEKYNIIETYIVDKKTKGLYYSEDIDGKRAAFKYRSIDKPNFRLIVSAKKGNQYYYANVPVRNLNRPFLSWRYVVDKDLFRPVTKKQLDKLFASR